MKFSFVHQHKQWHGVKPLCRALGSTPGGYYQWKKRSVSARTKGNAVLLSHIRRVHAESRGSYGSPRIFGALNDDGIVCSRKRVERVMRENGIRSKHKRPYRPSTTDSNHNISVSPNLLNRDFSRDKANQAWVADITYVKTDEGWLYLAAVLDLFSRKIVGWSVGKSLHRDLAIRALTMALQRRRPAKGLLHHSDRGCQYASADYAALLKEYGAVQSMSRKGNCWEGLPPRVQRTDGKFFPFTQSRASTRREI